MRDQKIWEWLNLNIDLPDPTALCAEELKQPAVVFVKNVEQALALSQFPVAMCKFGQKVKIAEITASKRLGYGECVLLVSKEQAPQVRELSRDILQGKAPPNIDPFSFMFQRSDFNDLIDEDTSKTFNTLMSAQIVMAWTAFETLAGDLWEAAMNAHPQTLVSTFSNNVKLDSKSKDEGKSIPLRYLEMNRFEIGDKMGTILKDAKCNFTTLDGVQAAYTAAFPEECQVQSKEFWRNESVRASSAVRNLIVHQGSIVDAEFLKKRGSHSQLATYKVGDQLALDGQLLQGLLRGLFAFTTEMITSVDKWISENPN